MFIYIIHAEEYFTFELPKIVSGNYILTDYDKDGNKRDLASIEAYNNQWRILSDTDTKVLQNHQAVSFIYLEMYKFYQLRVYNNEIVLIYTCPSNEVSYMRKMVSSNTEVIIGKSSTCDIKYLYNGIDEKQVKLVYENDRWELTNLQPLIPIYVNKQRQDHTLLNQTDQIFIMGLKIVILGEQLLINNPQNAVSLNGGKLLDPPPFTSTISKSLPMKLYKNFYDEKDYFFKAPVFQNKIEQLNLPIASPPPKEEKNKYSIFMTIIPSAIMCSTSAITGYYAIKNIHDKASMESNMTSILMCVAMLVVGVVWPFIERKMEEKIRKQNKKKRIRVYTSYLQKKGKILEDAINEQRIILQNNSISLKACQDTILNRKANLFSRNIEYDDFLKIRLGTGTVDLDGKIDYTKEEFEMEHDELRDQIDELIESHKTVSDVPVTLSLTSHHIVSFINDHVDKYRYMKSILLQLVTLQSYSDMKLVILTDRKGEDHFSSIKKLNHCFTSDYSTRFFATNIEEAQILSSYLEKVFIERINADEKDESEKVYKNFLPYYVIVTDNILLYRNLKIIKDILEHKCNIGFSILMFDAKITNIPNECSEFINFNEKSGTFFENVMTSKQLESFVPEFIDHDNGLDFDLCMDLLANIPIQVVTEKMANLPQNLGFLEMYRVGKVEQLNVANRWDNSSLMNSLQAPVGVDENGNLLVLDLHEKKHGPHGLIAGMTGSGKSEFIITYILSMAVNYRPDEVQFVLIDYKGGGLAGAFENRKTKEKLPHLIGTITNLDKAELKRTLVSIESELNRRQILFNSAKEQVGTGTIDIYKYQKLYRDGLLKESLSHLFIICDEFAELKDQQPDFMEQLVSAARIGRSLGIHLILATQKPSGVVDEQIWSNSKFKVCCKVQTAEDSQEMIRKNDAAYLKEAGRFYLQVGYDEYFVLGQSAYSGTSYFPSEKIRSKVDNALDFINHTGEIIKSVEEVEEAKEAHISLGEELSNVLHYLINVAREKQYKQKQLWLDNVSSIIYVENIKQKYPLEVKKCVINPVIGEFDNPRNQKQGVVTLPLTEVGNCFICGMTGSGKTTLLSTIIYSSIVSHDTSELNIYILDFSAQTLKIFEKAPQVGDFLTVSDDEKVKRLFSIMVSESQKRKSLFSDYGGSYQSYYKKTGVVLPNILIFINDFDVFKEEYEDIYDDIFTSLIRDCSKNGITFIVTASSVNSLGYRVENSFPQKIGLQVVDHTDYYDLFGTDKVIPAEYPGRGLIKMDNVYEFQSALIFEEDHLDSNLDYIFNQLNKITSAKAKRIPIMPEVIEINTVREAISTLDKVPIGVDRQTIEPFCYNFTNYLTFISSSEIRFLEKFIPALVKIMGMTRNVHPIVIDASESVTIEEQGKIKYYNSNFRKLFIYLYKNIQKYIGKEIAEKIPIIIIGYQKLEQHLEKVKQDGTKEVITVDDFILEAKASSVFKIILADEYGMMKTIKKRRWFDLMDSTTAIWLGENFDDQSIINAEYASSYNENVDANTAIVVINSKRNYVRYIQK